MSQIDYLPPEVRTWPREIVLDWLHRFGEIREWPLHAGSGEIVAVATSFRAASGLTTTFILTDDGKLSIFVGDHSMRAVWG